MKKILFFDQTLNGGGAERVLCTVMRGLDPKKYEIHLVLITKVGALSHLIPDYVHVHILGIPHTRKAFFPAVKVLRVVRPDIVYTTTVRTALLISITRYFCPYFKFIMRIPIMPDRLISDSSALHFRLMQFFYKRADYIISQSTEMKKELIRYFGIKDDKIKTINNPVDYEYIDSCTQNAANPFDTNLINVVASGTICSRKGFDVLIKSFAQVVQTNKNYHLHILGRDQKNNTQTLKNLCLNLNIFNNVHFLGFVKNPYPYYKFCDLFVLSSYMEGCPNVILEALYLECPVVATRCVPVLSRIIRDGENGFLVDPGSPEQLRDAILKFKKLFPEKGNQYNNEIINFIEQVDIY